MPFGAAAGTRGSRGIQKARVPALSETNRLQDISGDADGDALSGFSYRVACEVRIARGGLDPAVTEQSADDRQALAERERPRGERVAQVVDAHALQSARSRMRFK